MDNTTMNLQAHTDTQIYKRKKEVELLCQRLKKLVPERSKGNDAASQASDLLHELFKDFMAANDAMQQKDRHILNIVRATEEAMDVLTMIRSPDGKYCRLKSCTTNNLVADIGNDRTLDIINFPSDFLDGFPDDDSDAGESDDDKQESRDGAVSRARGRSRGQKNLGKTKMEDSDELDDMEKLILEREEKVMLEREQNPIDPQRLRRQVVE